MERDEGKTNSKGASAIMQVQELSIQQIVVTKRMRPLKDEAVRDLAESIEQVGLLTPITVSDGFKLIAGQHRLEAARMLGWQTIPAVIRSMNELDAELAEIDENLKRNDLTALEQGEHLARRKAIYEALHPETRQGGTAGVAGGGKKPKNDNLSSFAEDTAAKTGTSERTVQRDVKIGKIAEPVRDLIRNTEIADKKTELLKLAQMPEEQQRVVAQKIAAGQAESVTDAIKSLNMDTRRARLIEQNKQQIQTTPYIRYGDCLSVLSDVKDIDLLITDPPYFTDGDFTAVVSEFLSRVKSTGQAYVFCSADPDEVAAYLAMDRHGLILQQILVWNYNNTGQRQPNVKYNSNYQLALYFRGVDAPPINKPGDGTHQYACQTVNAPDGRIGDRFHSWQKPQELIERYVLNSSVEGDLVCDPFAGTGTTLLAAAKYNRRAVGADVDLSAIQIAAERGCVREV